MEFNETDIVKFYELLSRYNIKSPNIGVVGSRERFTRYIKCVLREFKDKHNSKIMVNEEKTVYRIIINDMEINYIYIGNSFDLRGRTFRKYV